jgi:hypothetical protein
VWGGWVEEGLIDDANAALFYIAVKKNEQQKMYPTRDVQLCKMSWLFK